MSDATDDPHYLRLQHFVERQRGLAISLAEAKHLDRRKAAAQVAEDIEWALAQIALSSDAPQS